MPSELSTNIVNRIKTLLLVLMLVSASAHASTSNLRFENASTYLDDGIYYLDAFARVEIGEEPEKALISGVELHFIVDVMVERDRRWWIDRTVVAHRLRYKLYFYELTRHYRVDNLDTGESENYRSLTAALRFLGQINRYALVESNRIKRSKRYKASIEVSLDNTRLPGPLVTQSIITDEWDLHSEVFEWSLN